MGLDLAAVSRQIAEQEGTLHANARALQTRVRAGWEELARQGSDPDRLSALALSIPAPQRYDFVQVVERPDRVVPAPAAPKDYAVLAVDGSQVGSDQHSPARCVLINLGAVHLTYGSAPGATLTSQPRVSLREEDCSVQDPNHPVGRRPIEGALLNALRGVKEAEELAARATAVPAGAPALLLLDNSLVPWGIRMHRFPEAVSQKLEQDYRAALATIRLAAADRPLALGGYVSRPDGAGLVNTLRLARANPGSRSAQVWPPNPAADELGGLLDRHLFTRLLVEPGARSVLLRNLAARGDAADPANEVFFFYLNTGDEIARVEVPGWVAGSAERLALVHALVWDQARRGFGYPVALAEAHEQAVVGFDDREQFWLLVERALEGCGYAPAPSAKSRAKRIRGV